MKNNRLILNRDELEFIEIFRELTEYNKGYVIQCAAERLKKQDSNSNKTIYNKNIDSKLIKLNF